MIANTNELIDELMNSWNEAYSDRLDESETLMLEQIRHHQRQLSE